MLALLPAGAQNLTIPNFFSDSDGTTYVQTGDIPAMRLRDWAARTTPYIRFIRNYAALGKAFYGVVDRDAKNILTNPYAEAFSADYHIWEAKWEIDSLAWPVVLVFAHYANTRERLRCSTRATCSTVRCTMMAFRVRRSARRTRSGRVALSDRRLLGDAKWRPATARF